MLTDGVTLPDGRNVIVGLQGVVLIGRGERYDTFQLPSREGFVSVLALDDATVVVAGEAGVRQLQLDDLPPPRESQ